MAAAAIPALVPLVEKVIDLVGKDGTKEDLTGGGAVPEGHSAASLAGWNSTKITCSADMPMDYDRDFKIELGVNYDCAGQLDGVGAYVANADLYANVHQAPRTGHPEISGGFGEAINVGSEDNPIAQITANVKILYHLTFDADEIKHFIAHIRGDGNSTFEPA